MKKTSKPIVFFGSGPVAAASLVFLSKHFEIEGVVTKTSTAKEMKATAPETPQYLINNRKELTEFMHTKPFSSEVGVIVDYGVIVDQEVIDYFKFGIINSHFSLLPEWRGADPISFSILSGQTQTGVSLMRIVSALDEGDLLAQERLNIDSDETTPSLTDQLVRISNEMLVEYLPKYVDGQLNPYPQDEGVVPSYSRKLTKQDGVLDWTKPAVQLDREIRAFADWPKSRTTLGGKDVIITKAHVVEAGGKPGDINTDNKQIVITCGEQALSLDELKPAGKGVMSAQAFLAGNKIS